MGIIKFKAEESQGFSYTPGDYTGFISGIERKKSKTGKHFYMLTIKGDDFGSINHNIFDTAFGRADLFNIYSAIGIDPKREDIEEEEILEKWFAFTIVEGDEYNGKPTWNATDFRTAGEVEVEDEEDDDDDW